MGGSSSNLGLGAGSSYTSNAQASNAASTGQGQQPSRSFQSDDFGYLSSLIPSMKNIPSLPTDARPTAPTYDRKYYEAEYRRRNYSSAQSDSTSTDQLKPYESRFPIVDEPPPRQSFYQMDSISPELKYRGSKGAYGSNSFNSTIPTYRMTSSDTMAGELAPNETTITIFGFPTSASAQVISSFQQIGPVLKCEMGSGNWAHITYASSWSANKALSKNGKVFPGGTFMVGVLPSHDAQKQLDRASESFNTPARGVTGVRGEQTTQRVAFEHNIVPRTALHVDGTRTTTTGTSAIAGAPTAAQLGSNNNSNIPASPRVNLATLEASSDSFSAKLVKYIFGW